MTTTYIGNYYEWTGAISTTVKYYYAGTTRIAMRVGNGTQTEGLYWLLTDHLGSTAITTDNAGNKSGEVRYKAWGDTRFTSGSTPTTFRFTGQRQEEQLGLYFYNARWYDPALGRFIQADTIVPGLGNSQAWDRYAYTLNNPLRYVDPSGFTVDCAGWDTACKIGKAASPKTIAAKFDAKFTDKNGTWTVGHQWEAVHAIIAVAYSFAYEMGKGISGQDAFKAVYDHIELVWDIYCEQCKGGGGYTPSPHKIIFASLSEPGGNRTTAMAFLNARNNVVHELGHAFAQLWYGQDGKYDSTGPYLNIPSIFFQNEGFYPSPESASRTWRQHPCTSNDCTGQEAFADMFLGWTFDMWESNKMGADRDFFMTTNMTVWISDALR